LDWRQSHWTGRRAIGRKQSHRTQSHWTGRATQSIAQHYKAHCPLHQSGAGRTSHSIPKHTAPTPERRGEWQSIIQHTRSHCLLRQSGAGLGRSTQSITQHTRAHSPRARAARGLAEHHTAYQSAPSSAPERRGQINTEHHTTYQSTLPPR